MLYHRCVHVLLCALLSAGLCAAGTAYTLPRLAPEPSAAPAGTRAMWVWSAADPAALLAWATSHGIKTIFAYVETNGDDDARLRELKRRCDAAGVTLDALGGEPEWTVDHARALAWRDTVNRLGLFRGIHVDVEPYLLPTWATARDDLVRSYLSLLDRLGSGPRLEVDVPFWYGEIPAPGGSLADAILERVDAVTVMSYRNSGSSIVEVGTDLLRRGSRAARPVRLAAETSPTPDCDRCSFHGTAARELTAALAAVDEAGRRYPAFAGIAVHDYASWSSLPE